MEESTIWKMIDIYFQDNPQALVKHHIDSFNQFYDTELIQLFKEMNPIKLEVDYDTDIQEFRSKCLMYIGGKNGDKVYFGKPIIHDSKEDSHYMYPNECRLRNMSYAITIHYDVEIEYTRILRENEVPTATDENGYAFYDDLDIKEKTENGEILKKDYTPSELATIRENTKIQSNTQNIKMLLEKIYLGRFPIMVQSNLCILHNLPREMRFSFGECKNDVGGYFIIDGKEKVVIPQEQFGNNMMNIYKDKNEKYTFSLDFKSVSENVSKPVRQLSIRILASTDTQQKNNIGVFIPNAGAQPIPLFIVFRALGVISDDEIISFCTLQDAKHTNSLFVPYLEACVHDAASIITQYEAIYFISLFVKGRSITRTMRILTDYFLPHVGEVNYLEKAYHLGHMVNRLMAVATGLESVTERDSYKFKRLELIGPLMKNLFTEYYKQQQKYIQKFFEHRYEFGKDTYNDLSNMIYRKYTEAFSNKIVEEGFQKAFKGNWGASSHTKKIGIVQDMNRLSHNGMISHLRKINLPMDSSIKLIQPRVLHGSQWGIIDPIDTPDGGNIGLHKHLSILTHVSTSLSREPMIDWLTKNSALKKLNHSIPSSLNRLSKVFVNGLWIGCVADPLTLIKTIKVHRRHGLIPITTSATFNYTLNLITIFLDGGRLCRPIFYSDDNRKFVFQQKDEWEKIKKKLLEEGEIWSKIVSGFHKKEDPGFNLYAGKYYTWEELYKTPIENMKHSKSLLEYIDSQETEGTLIAMNFIDVKSEITNHTHCEVHPSTTYGVMCNLINYLEHNPVTRNSFSCGQSKQACSLYSTNYQVRMDKTAVVLNNGQIPLVKSKYMQYINNEENPYGENAIVAIMCYTGYNVEDAVLINEAALHRGLFRTTYYTTYEAHEEKEIRNDVVTNEQVFCNIQDLNEVEGVKPDYDYSYLNKQGLIPENTEVHDKIILIGQTALLDSRTGKKKDMSKTTKKGQVGIVDKAFMTEGEEGQRIAKIRIREERIPTFGDKFASRAGQKGTVGMVIPECDMPFTKDGIRPDMIVNPHALPSRMTIGQMIESIVGKACTFEGTAGDCTAFYNRENKLGMFGEILTKHNFHSNGDEIMYDGMTGKQLEATVFIGPTYYMRLKHMVKDKINYRATGPLTKLTRQPVSGRANDGGLRIGEMERDAVISHGMSYFLKESMMDRADAYKLAICNKTGMVAIYNPSKDLLISPSADGPIQYNGTVEKEENNIGVKQITKHGRSFSIVHVPYSLNLLVNELKCINVQMHIITDDNINQFENMNFSKNIRFGKDETPQTIIQQIQNNLNKKLVKQSILESSIEDEYKNSEKFPTIGMSPEEIDIAGLMARQDEMTNIPPRAPFNINHIFPPKKVAPRSPDDPPPPRSPDYPPPPESPEWATTSPYSPPYNPNGSPPYNPNGSPPYNPNDSQQYNLYDDSPPYNPNDSQQYNLYDDSPPYNPNSDSPEYHPTPREGTNTHQQGENVPFQLHDKVFFKGDSSNPTRIWSIVHANELGKSYIIETEDLAGINVESSKLLVNEKDIRKPLLFDYNANQNTQENDYSQNITLPTSHPSYNFQDPPAPVMNIVKIYNQTPADSATTSPIPSELMEDVTNLESINQNMPDFKVNNFTIEKLEK